VIGIHVLSDESDFANTRVCQPRDLGHDFVDRAGGLRAARIRHDTECAELVATLLHGDEGGNAARPHSRNARRGELVELVVGGKLGIDRLAVTLSTRDEVR
jgi:hypothetical protein